MQLECKVSDYKERIDRVLHAQLQGQPKLAPVLLLAMEHGLLLGGKRLRPVLVYVTGEMLGATADELDYAAAAIECIHAYSLIHDDLPAMDDDDLRRNQPTVHKAFDEASAILAGDALQTLAFSIIADAPATLLSPAVKVTLISTLAQASGYQGMCGGQALDLAAEDHQLSLDELETIHRHKTGALIRCAVLLGAQTAQCDDPGQLEALAEYAQRIGLAFQVQDDILDLTSDTQTLGKPQGSDVRQHKSTYPALLGLDKARDMALALERQALQSLDNLPYNTEILEAFAHLIVSRNR
ncbi:(2E,6E)-farnesyl diphosphate synthase [Dongshaea marina]|uniref:(2E,6E)-farnesyl diphosphate synthase n=1 Tax=Dongshaea marina TaxID=2047966 RepID=UPI001F1EB6EF|nr:(2E,6E)-farnesyl diphosphate synthase [Dongshaea marina]